MTGNYAGFSASPSLYCLGMDEDMEREQMAGDVPTLPVFALEPNLFSDRRELLGMSNLMTSFARTAASSSMKVPADPFARRDGLTSRESRYECGHVRCRGVAALV